LGNVWVTNKLGSSLNGALKFAEMLAAFKFNFDNDPDAGQRVTKVLVPAMSEEKSGYEAPRQPGSWSCVASAPSIVLAV
jgi:hypothetical protein